MNLWQTFYPPALCGSDSMGYNLILNGKNDWDSNFLNLEGVELSISTGNIANEKDMKSLLEI